MLKRGLMMLMMTAAGVAGGILVDTGVSPTAPIALTNGAIANHMIPNITVSATIMNNLIANPAGFYFNVHTVLNPVGAVRGQLVRP